MCMLKSLHVFDFYPPMCTNHNAMPVSKKCFTRVKTQFILPTCIRDTIYDYISFSVRLDTLIFDRMQ